MIRADKDAVHIAHCVPIFSELTQTFVYELVGNTRIYNPDMNVRVLTWQRKNADSRPFEPVDTVPPPSRSEIVRLRVARLLPDSIERLLPPTVFERRVTERLKQANLDLVHAHFGPTAVLIGRACRLAGVPLVVTFRGRDASAKLRKWHWRRLYRRTLTHAAAVTCVSDDLLAQLKPVLPVGLPAQTVMGGKQPKRLEYRSPPAPRGCLVSVGRLIQKKGHLDAIRAVARVRENGVVVSLTIIGEGPMRARLEDEIMRLGLANAVTLTGALPYEEVIEQMEKADFLMAVNRTADNGDCEGIPNVIKEAQLVGLPVIATRHGGIPQAVPRQMHTALVEEGDIEAMAVRIAQLCAMPQTELEEIARRGRAHVLSTFDPSAEVGAYRALYESLLSIPKLAREHVRSSA